MKCENECHRRLVRNVGRRLIIVIPTIALVVVAIATAQIGTFTKAQVADRIRKVEDGVDEFRKYLENRGDNARDNAQAAQSSGRARRGTANADNADSRQQRARQNDRDAISPHRRTPLRRAAKSERHANDHQVDR